MSPYLRAHSDGAYLAAKVQPRSAKNEIGEAVGAELKIKVTAPPVDAAANEALIRLLAERLGCSRNCVQIVRGQTSRHKLIFIKDLDPAFIEKQLESSLSRHPNNKR